MSSSDTNISRWEAGARDERAHVNSSQINEYFSCQMFGDDSSPSANLFSSSVLPMALAAEHICLRTSSRRLMQRMMLPGETETSGVRVSSRPGRQTIGRWTWRIVVAASWNPAGGCKQRVKSDLQPRIHNWLGGSSTRVKDLKNKTFKLKLNNLMLWTINLAQKQLLDSANISTLIILTINLIRLRSQQGGADKLWRRADFD